MSAEEALAAALDEADAATSAAAAVHDCQTGARWSRHGARWFHAASTIKVAVLAALYATLEADGLDPDHPLPVRNRFSSLADGSPYALQPSRDTDADVYAAIGGTLPIRDLARRMIAVSSNLATNVLLDFVGVARARAILASAGLEGIDLVRGVEDDRAFEAGLSNRVTADGLVALFRAIHEARFCSPARTAELIRILSAQTFVEGIPAGLPPAIRAVARVAHKTGEISQATHDAGLVFLPGRRPYALAVLTASGARPARYAPVARISARAFDWVTGRAEWENGR